MYFIIYGFLYLIALLPFPLLYLLSDVVFVLLYYVFGYRRKIVMAHLCASFPEKTSKELQQIERQFFRNFTDTWLEMIKMLRLSKSAAAKRIQCNFSILDQYIDSGQSVQLYAGHFMNWEYVNVAVPAFQPIPFLGIYMPLSNKNLEKIIFNIRSRFGTILLKAGSMKTDMVPWLQKQYIMGLGADQSPGDPTAAFWLYYMHQPTAFVKGPWVRACQLQQPSIYLQCLKVKRGYYAFNMLPFAVPANEDSPEARVRLFASMLEKDILANPANYLWSHKRWKKHWNSSYANAWVDAAPMP